VLISNSPTRGRHTSVTSVAQPVCADTPITKAIGSNASNDISTDRLITQAPPRPEKTPRERARKFTEDAAATSAGSVSGNN
jgi:hypothetical protein